MIDPDFGGFSVAYEQDELPFPIFILAGISATCLFEAINLPSVALFVAGLGLAATIYHNAPLLEAGQPRLATSSKGLAIHALGIIGWRSISSIELVSSSLRGSVYYEIRITLNRPLASALLADRRHLPLHRAVMRRPWKLLKPLTIRIPSDIFDLPANEIHDSLIRSWTFYRGKARTLRRHRNSGVQREPNAQLDNLQGCP